MATTQRRAKKDKRTYRGWQLATKADGSCAHPSARHFAWFAWNCHTGKNDILCCVCLECREVLAGGAE